MYKEFTHDYYRLFLDKLSKYYNFIDFEEGKQLSKPDFGNNNHCSFVIMRHDIDMDLHAALLLSGIEKEFGISSIYFVMLRCPVYNLLDAQNAEYLYRIISNGHKIGLHFDCAAYDQITVTNLESLIDKECQVMNAYFGISIHTISFHRPGPIDLTNVILDKYLNTYEKVYLEYFSYFSDSRSRWARGNPLDSIEYNSHKNLHILTHPVWWNQEFTKPYERLIKIVQNKKTTAESFLKYNCSVWNEGQSEYHKDA